MKGMLSFWILVRVFELSKVDSVESFALPMLGQRNRWIKKIEKMTEAKVNL
jgi:hypothetical protein